MARVMEDSAQNIPALIRHMQKGAAADAQEDHVRGAEVDATLAARKQMVSQAQVDAVRARLSAEEGARCSDQTINQFLRATVCNIDQAVKRLQETLAWRGANDVERASCSACITNPRSHYMHPVGFDRYGRPVLYSCLQLAANRSVEDNRRHMVATFEQTIRLMGPSVEQWVWVSDFYGFGFADLSPRIAQTFLELSARHYPERLGAFLVIGAPTIFNGLWSMLQPLVDPVSRKKIHMLPYDASAKGSSLESALAEFFDADLAQWLLTEMAQNRDKAVGAKKVRGGVPCSQVYPYGRVLSAPAAWKGHDLRGTPAMLEALQQL